MFDFEIRIVRQKCIVYVCGLGVSHCIVVHKYGFQWVNRFS